MFETFLDSLSYMSFAIVNMNTSVAIYGLHLQWALEVSGIRDYTPSICTYI